MANPDDPEAGRDEPILPRAPTPRAFDQALISLLIGACICVLPTLAFRMLG